MAKNSGRFDMEDVGWEKPEEEDPLTKLLIRSSKEVQNGAIWGFFVGLAIGLASLALALMVNKAFWCVSLGALIIGLIGGAIVGKVIEVRRTIRRRARRAKMDAQEAKRKKKAPREVHEDDLRGN